MLEQKQSAFSTQQSRRNTELYTISSRVSRVQIKYDINDFLPPDSQFQPPHHLFSFARQQKEEGYGFTQRTVKNQGYQNQDQDQRDSGYHSYKDAIGNLQQMIKQKDSEIQKITKQYQENHKTKQEKIKQLSQQINQLLNKSSKLMTQNEAYIIKLNNLTDNLQKQKQQKQSAVQQATQLKKSLLNKTKNIRIFCQKYQLSIPPKTKQTYTIQVQTEPQPQLSIAQPILEPLQPSPHFPSQVQISNKSSNFYALYQKQVNEQKLNSNPITHSNYNLKFNQESAIEKQFDFNFNINSYPISRSQVMGFESGKKISRPAILGTDRERDWEKGREKQKENDKRILNRIQGLVNKDKDREKDRLSKQKIKIKNQVIQICPIDQNYIEDIVFGILNK